ncbi:MAG: proline racemase [Candidatus Marinimicrobia bacterium]|jgi:trans-L-3-hydroxyproline dehydratase|nr:proline racemase [Candidatus Neomarinimicrobiota bacterium]MBT3676337.1 proline racemase [Candidatus Neomarinimicrobiota bacterium]MBT3763712.1 proline racemase [Candidatus Neomarinimicrobiota bacterium]MBT4067269.1 proline racemase [Candidatus Neomarinimicrobiota bacterium]MBT4271083.1 proline racemase [Candidatus Neomarinimicrobiota bacterium]
MIKILKLKNWSPPKNWQEIQTIDAHTGGEPLRIILSGYPELTGNTLLEKRADARDNHDNIRKALMWEPRGHADMYGAIIVAPDTPGADFGVIFIHNEGYSTGCGHAVIALTKVIVETGLIPMTKPETEVKMDVPSGFIRAVAAIENGKVTGVRFQNVPSFVQKMDSEIDVPGLGKIKYDLAFGGAFYAFVDVDQVGLDCTEVHQQALIEKGMIIKRAIVESVKMDHPTEPDMNFLYGTIFTGPPEDPNHHSRNVCIFAEGEVDRSPTGTGVSARAAIHYARGEISVGEPITIESIIGSTFSVKVDEVTSFGKYDAVIPEVNGNAFITGKNTFWINPDDPLKDGFILR